MAIVQILSASEEAFCQYYSEDRDRARAYRLAYKCDPNSLPATQFEEATRLMRRQHVVDRINALNAAAAATVTLGLAELQQSWVDMAEADPNELIGLRIGCCRYCHGIDHQYQWRQREFIEACAQVERSNRHAKKEADKEPLPEFAGGLDFNHTLAPVSGCPECHGEGVSRVVARDTSKLSKAGKLLYGGVKVKKDGSIEMIIADRVKARENAVRMQGGFSDGYKLDANIKLMAAHVDLAGKDPQAASRIYEQVVKGVAIK